MTNYEWKVRQIEVVNQDSLEGVVVTVCFDFNANENGLVGFFQGDVRVFPPNPAAFTKLDDLTENQVIGWVKDALGPDRVAAYEQRLQQQINSQKTPQPKVVPLPWDAA